MDGEEVASVWRMVRDGERTPQSPQLQVELTCAHQPTIVSVDCRLIICTIEHINFTIKQLHTEKRAHQSSWLQIIEYLYMAK